MTDATKRKLDTIEFYPRPWGVVISILNAVVYAGLAVSMIGLVILAFTQ
jgi:hypothetical protein